MWQQQTITPSTSQTQKAEEMFTRESKEPLETNR
jgi:hypothetical protein